MRAAVRLLAACLILFTPFFAHTQPRRPYSLDGVIDALRENMKAPTEQLKRLGYEAVVAAVRRRKVDFLLNNETAAMLLGAGANRAVLNAILHNGPDRERYAEFGRHKAADSKDAACAAAKSYEREFPRAYEPRVAEVREFIAANKCGDGGEVKPPKEDEKDKLRLKEWETRMKEGEQALSDNPRREAEAELAFKRAQQLRTDDWLAFSKLAELYSSQKRYADAIREFVGALALKPGDPRLLRGLGMAHLNMNNYGEAARVLKEAVDHGAADAETYFYLGRANFSRERYPEAADAFNGAIKIKPNDAQLYFEVGNTYLRMKQEKEAFDSYNRAVDHNPDFRAAALELVRLRQNDPQAHERLGDVYLRAKSYNDAKASYRQAMSLSPDRKVSGEPLGYWHIRAAEHARGEVVMVTDGKLKLMERANLVLNGSEFQGALTVCLNEIRRLLPSRVTIARKEPGSDRCTERSTIKVTAVKEEQRFVDFTHNNKGYVLAINWYRYIEDTQDDFIEFAIFRKASP